MVKPQHTACEVDERGQQRLFQHCRRTSICELLCLVNIIQNPPVDFMASVTVGPGEETEICNDGTSFKSRSTDVFF